MNRRTVYSMVLIVSVCLQATLFGQAESGNLIANGDFQAGKLGELPDGWSFSTARPALARMALS